MQDIKCSVETYFYMSQCRNTKNRIKSMIFYTFAPWKLSQGIVSIIKAIKASFYSSSYTLSKFGHWCLSYIIIKLYDKDEEEE